MEKPWRFISVAALTLAALCVPASGAIAYHYGTDASHYDFDADTLTVNVYLVETLTDGSPSKIAGVGLSGAAFRVDRIAGDAAKIVGLFPNPAFDAGEPFNLITVADDSAALSVAAFTDGVDLTLPGKVWIGSILLAPDSGQGAAEFELNLYDSFVGNVVLADAAYTALDDPAVTELTPLQGGTRFTVAFPEPATAAWTLGAIALFVRRRRATSSCVISHEGCVR